MCKRLVVKVWFDRNDYEDKFTHDAIDSLNDVSELEHLCNVKYRDYEVLVVYSGDFREQFEPIVISNSL